MARNHSGVVTVPACDTFTVAIPVAPPRAPDAPLPYRTTHIECRLSAKEAEGLGLLHDGVFGRSLKFRGDTHCNQPNDSLRWLLAEIADRSAAALNR